MSSIEELLKPKTVDEAIAWQKEQDALLMEKLLERFGQDDIVVAACFKCAADNIRSGRVKTPDEIRASLATMLYPIYGRMTPGIVWAITKNLK